MKDRIIIDLEELHKEILDKYKLSVNDFCNIVDYIKQKKIIKLNK